MNLNDVQIPWDGWRLEAQENIHKGQFGAVYKISRELYGVTEYAAMKVISIPSDPQQIANDFSYGYDRDSIATKYRSYCDDIINEFKLMMTLKGNANIVRCDDVSVMPHEDGIGWDVYIRMEYLIPFQEYHKNIVTESDVIKLGIDMCNALQACEQNNIIHRDIKPSNILISEQGDYKLGDFGVSRTLEHENTYGTKGIGTYDFMSPEVYKGDKYGLGADIYSLGMVMYWLLNRRTFPFLAKGKAPTPSEKEESYRRRFGGEQFPEPEMGSEELKRIVLKACSYNPADRYQNASDMRSDLINLSHNTSYTPTEKPKEINNTWADSSETVGKQYSVNDGIDDSGTRGKETTIKTKPKSKSNVLILVLCLTGAAIVFSTLVFTVLLILGSRQKKTNTTTATSIVTEQSIASEPEESVGFVYSDKTPFYANPECTGLPMGFLNRGLRVKIAESYESSESIKINVVDVSSIPESIDYYVKNTALSQENVSQSDTIIFESSELSISKTAVVNGEETAYSDGIVNPTSIRYVVTNKEVADCDLTMCVKCISSFGIWNPEREAGSSNNEQAFEFYSSEGEQGSTVAPGEYIVIMRRSDSSILFVDHLVIGEYYTESGINNSNLVLYVTNDDNNVSNTFDISTDHVNVWLFNLKTSTIDLNVNIVSYDGTYSWNPTEYKVDPRFWRGGTFQSAQGETIPEGLYLIVVRESETNNIVLVDSFLVN